MPAKQASNIIYLSVAYGMFRRKCSSDHPDVVVRENKKGEKSYAIEYFEVSGALVNVKFYDHPDFGKSWTLYVDDGDQKWGIKLSEKSRFCAPFLRCFPNLVQGQWYAFHPYDYERNGKRKVGFSIKYQGVGDNGALEMVNVEDHYQDFEQQEDESWIVRSKNGYPESENINFSDEDETTIYYTRVAKFLREQALPLLKQKFDSNWNGSIVPPKEPDLVKPKFKSEEESELDAPVDSEPTKEPAEYGFTEPFGNVPPPEDEDDLPF